MAMLCWDCLLRRLPVFPTLVGCRVWAGRREAVESVLIQPLITLARLTLLRLARPAPRPSSVVLMDLLTAKAAEPLHALGLLIKKNVPANFGTAYSFPLYRQAGWSPSTFPYLEVIVLFSLAFFFFETWLSLRNHAKLHIKKPPEALEKVVTAIDKEKDLKLWGGIVEKFTKAQSYNLDKRPFIWDKSVEVAAQWGYSDNEYVISLVFLGINMIYEQVVHLPFTLYFTFVLEQKHGFNKSTLGLFIADKIKTIVLFALIGGPVVSAFIYIIKWGGEKFPIYLWLFTFVFSLLMTTIYPTLIAPLFNKFEPLSDLDLKAKIEALASRVGFPLTKLFVIDGSKRSAHSNAYFFGFFKNKRIVLFDTLLKQAEEKEIVAILGHELGHWKFSHTIQMFAVSQVHMLALFYVFGFSLHDNDLFVSFGFKSKPTLIGLLLFMQVIWSPIDKVLGFLMNVWSRKNEFEADHFACTLGYGPELQTGLVKLHIENLGNLNPDPWYSTYHYSHPPMVERLTAINRQLRKKA